MKLSFYLNLYLELYGGGGEGGERVAMRGMHGRTCACEYKDLNLFSAVPPLAASSKLSSKEPHIHKETYYSVSGTTHTHTHTKTLTK
jgi:hypothetical protein